MFEFLPSDLPLWSVMTVLALATIVIGISKSGFGGTTAILAMPMIANLIPIEQTLGFMLPILMTADLIAMKHHWQKQSWKLVRWVCIGAFVGIMIAMLALWLLAQHEMLLNTSIRFTVGVMCLGFVSFQVMRELGMKLPHVPESKISGYACGCITGVVSTLANAGGPVVSIYMLEQKLGKAKLTGTMVAMFLIINWLKVPGFILLGILSPGAVLLALCFLPLVPVGSVLGLWLHRHVNETIFNAVIYAATVVASISLIYKAITMS